MVEDYKRKVGVGGEHKAAHYLEEKGYVILERNYRTRKGEIDIICEKNGTLIFVEVKTRTAKSFGEPSEAINPHKVKKIIEVAEDYASRKGLLGICDTRFDVISISYSEDKESIEHIKDAFRSL
ncbi:MAG TPA: YraN family protein [bacterium (Candidatus Stahlbacteria)]|nr:YraN family protein [Candidatus Stahlbacteria bacterium]